MKVIFSHGQESGPWGSKIKRLAALAESSGYTVDSVDYRGIAAPDDRVAILQEILADEEGEIVLVGSSMGGYVSLAATEKFEASGIFLLAPALFIPGYDRQSFRLDHHRLEIVHGWADEIIPNENSIRFAREANATLHLIAGDHRLIDSLETVMTLFSSFLDALMKKET